MLEAIHIYFVGKNVGIEAVVAQRFQLNLMGCNSEGKDNGNVLFLKINDDKRVKK